MATDISLKDMAAIISTEMNPGMPVTIKITSHFFTGYLRGVVAWCHPLPTSGNLLKLESRAWRMGLTIIASSNEEAEFMRKLFEAA
jgi:hypothetical protein